MTPIRPGIRRLLRVGGTSSQDARRDVDDEIELHIALRAQQLMEEGYGAEAAAAEARRRFAVGQATVHTLYETARERNDHMRVRERVDSWMQDTRYAARGLVRDPLLAIFVVLTLALGIGANVTAFSFVDRLLLRGPAHVPEADELVRLYSHTGSGTDEETTSAWIPYANYTNLRDGATQTIAAIGAYRVRPTMVGRGRDGRMQPVAQTTDGFFQALGVRPLIGRFFEPDEDAVSAGSLAVLSTELWRSHFASDAAAVGRSIMINGEAHTVVGIAPEGFSGPETRRVAAWTLANSNGARNLNWNIVARLRAGATLGAVTAEVQTVHQRTAENGARWMREASMLAAPIHYGPSAQEPVEATMARWMAAVSGVILLITFANVVNLLLVRLARRRRELAIRVALGSGRARVIRLLALEGALLAVTGGVAALFVARMTEPLVRRALFSGDAAWSFSIADGRVLAAVALFVLVSCVLVGVLPALLQTNDPRLTATLRTGGASGGSRAGMRATLTVLQAALSVVLLVAAGLFVRSLANVRAVELGVEPERVIVATAALPRPDLLFGADWFAPGLAAERDTYRRLNDAVRALPGVERSSVALGLPLDGGSYSTGVWAEGADSVSGDGGGGAYISAVTDDYFETVGTRIIRGRGFTPADREGSESVVVVNETMAERLWPDRDALDACARLGGPSVPCSRVVGVVADVRRTGLRDEPRLQFYIPFGQHGGFMGASLLVRPTSNQALQWEQLRQAMLDADPSINGVELQWMTAALEGEVRPLRIGMVTFGLAAVLALLVAALGLYSLMAYMVAWRTREIGVRSALGATSTEITRLIVRNGLSLAALGVVIGIAVTIAAGRWIEPQLFNVSPRDPLVLAGVSASLLLVALLAAWVPVRRALRISPTIALRGE